jgi:hypothetical protein
VDKKMEYGESVKMVFYSEMQNEKNFDIYHDVWYGDRKVKEEIVAKWDGKTYKLTYIGRQTNEEPSKIERELEFHDGRSLHIYVQNVQRQPDSWEERINWVKSVWGLVHMYIEDPFGKYERLEKERLESGRLEGEQNQNE